jgi:hypothetical protein
VRLLHFVAALPGFNLVLTINKRRIQDILRERKEYKKNRKNDKDEG